MLPNIFPPFPDRSEFDIYATMTPAKEVGGDFYDFFMIDDDHLALVIADVSGKGVPASLFMMVSKTLIKNQLMGGGDAQPSRNFNRVLSVFPLFMRVCGRKYYFFTISKPSFSLTTRFSFIR